MKKFLSFALSLIMAVAISVPAFAAEPTASTPPAITSQENTDTGNVVNSATFKLVPLSRKTF